MMQANNKISVNALLVPERIFIMKGCPSKAEVMARLAQAVCAEPPVLDASDVLAQVLKREEGVSTTLDTGLSIPHVRLEETDRFRAALAVLPDGAAENIPSRAGIKAMFFFVSPAKPAFFQSHLQLLAALAETFRPDMLARLSACHSAQAVLAEIEKNKSPLF